jgi:hypothetical protein
MQHYTSTQIKVKEYVCIKVDEKVKCKWPTYVIIQYVLFIKFKGVC